MKMRLLEITQIQNFTGCNCCKERLEIMTYCLWYYERKYRRKYITNWRKKIILDKIKSTTKPTHYDEVVRQFIKNTFENIYKIKILWLFFVQFIFSLPSCNLLLPSIIAPSLLISHPSKAFWQSPDNSVSA